jgi:hypothetical protein
MDEPVPLHRVQRAIFNFCSVYADAVIFGAQAVNVYLPRHPRMTADVDILSRDPHAAAEILARSLHDLLHIAARTRSVAEGKGWRVYQSGPHKRHLADLRLLDFDVPLGPVVEGQPRVVALPTLIAMKCISYARRQTTAKGATDRADLLRLWHAYPEVFASQETENALRMLTRGEPLTMAFLVWRDILVHVERLPDREWPDDEDVDDEGDAI